MSETEGVLTPNQLRTQAATAAAKEAARLRRIKKHVEALEAEGFVVRLEQS